MTERYELIDDRVHFPGSRQYNSIGDIENADELGGAESGDVVKVMGTKEICAKAGELLQASFSKHIAAKLIFPDPIGAATDS